jgi:hypothetical protein
MVSWLFLRVELLSQICLGFHRTRLPIVLSLNFEGFSAGTLWARIALP